MQVTEMNYAWHEMYIQFTFNAKPIWDWESFPLEIRRCIFETWWKTRVEYRPSNRKSSFFVSTENIWGCKLHINRSWWVMTNICTHFMDVCDACAAVFQSGRHMSDKRNPVLSRNEVVYVWAVKNKCINVCVCVSDDTDVLYWHLEVPKYREC